MTQSKQFLVPTTGQKTPEPMKLVLKLRFLVLAILKGLSTLSPSYSYSYSAEGGTRTRTRTRFIAGEHEHEHEYDRKDSGQSRAMFVLLMMFLVITFAMIGNCSSAVAQSNDRLPSSIGASIDSATGIPLFDSAERVLQANEKANDEKEVALIADSLTGPAQWVSPKGLSGSLQILLLLTVLSLAPAILLMTTCYIRIIVVLGLLRQALGAAQLPPSQVITSIALFVTLFVMAPVWSRVYDEAIKPYTDGTSNMTAEQAFEKGIAPVRQFMSRQIEMAGNEDDVHMFYQRNSPGSPAPQSFDDVPLKVLLPAYMLSELKTAFMMGFIIYLPFLILDIVIASVTISMGMMMLPPAMISMPFKLLLFVLVDGWHLVVQMLLDSFGTYAA
jgi:flagellar biosynthetic protein FliP